MKTGEWESIPAYHPWRRVLIAVGIIVAVMLAVMFWNGNEASASTCKTSTRQDRHVAVGGLTVGRATWIASGCYSRKGVESLRLTVRLDYVNEPFRYVGVVSKWREGFGHMIIRGARVQWDFCLPIAGCVSAGTSAWQVAFDEYGNWGWRVP